jgi:hypothetical protein
MGPDYATLRNKCKMTAISSQISHIFKYDGHNYSLRKLGLWVLLIELNLIQIVTGEETLPDVGLLVAIKNYVIH